MFRGRKFTGEWVYGDKVTIDKGKVSERVLIIPDPNLFEIPLYDDCYAISGLVEVNPETVGQFTGRFDKNKREIYAGDLAIRNSVIFEIVHHEAFAGFFAKTKVAGTDNEFDLLMIDDTFEVVGNTHDNPEFIG